MALDAIAGGAWLAGCLVLWLASPAGCSSGARDYTKERERMVEQQIVARGVHDPRVIAAMKKVPRERFVPRALAYLAYGDSALPIGSGQTISQPYIVAVMTAALGLEGRGKVLEVGTGSGYQAAVLSLVADTVYTIEILPELAKRSAALLDSLGYRNVHVRAGDGFDGWPSAAPFDGVIITAAAPRVPEPLAAQLKTGVRLVIPVGEEWQELEVYEKTAGGLRIVSTLPVRFVPMTGKIREGK